MTTLIDKIKAKGGRKLTTLIDKMEGKGGRWEWHATFRLPAARYQEEILPFLRKLKNTEHIQIGCLGGFFTKPFFHVHVIATGHSNRKKSLKHVNKAYWQEQWGKLAGLRSNALVIRDVKDTREDSNNVQGYVFEKHIKSEPDADYFFFNKSLLERYKLA